MHRLALLVLLAVLLAGCGGDDAPSADPGKDPASALPPDLPVALKVGTDLSSGQWESALAFAERLDPGERDLAAALREELGGDGVSFEEDVEPWLGEEIVVGIGDVQADDPVGVVAVATSDEQATRDTLAKGDDEEREATYEGVEYAVDEGGEATAVVDGFLVGANDEEQLKAAVDAVRGESLADSDGYRDAVADAPEERLAVAYADQDGLYDLLAAAGVPAETIESAKSVEGYEPGHSFVMSLVAEDDAMAVELVGPSAAEPRDGPQVADLASGAWLAAAGALPEGFAEEFARAFEQSFEAAAPQATPMLDRFGALAFLEGLESVSMRVGGASVQALNGELALVGSDAGAARTLFERAVGALRQEGAPVQVEGRTATLTIPPFAARLSADEGTLRIEAGEQPDGTLGDDDSFGEAEEGLGLDEVGLFVDFAPLEELARTLPQDASIEEALPVLAELGTLVAGSEVDDGTARARVVLSLR